VTRSWNGDELKSQLMSVFAQSQFSTLLALFFTQMEDSFVIGFFGEQNMKEDTSDLVRGGRDCGGCAQLREPLKNSPSRIQCG
jgi:hypothetical protein